jgi:RsiW-degrading membrane proteinase PrsW (M82 family)
MADNHVGAGASAVMAALPILIYLLVIWRLDRYEREPLWLVGVTFLYGAIGAIILAVILSLGVMVAAGTDDFTFGASVVAPLCEEPAKGLIVFLLLFTRHFDNTTDGLIYGAATGLGFAMTENFMYFNQADEIGGVEAWQLVVILRSLFTALMHCAASAAFGAILGRFRYRSGAQQWLLAPLLGLLVAMSLHAAFNSALVFSVTTGTDELKIIGLGLIPIAAIILFTITMVSLGREHRMLAAQLRDEATQGFIPAAHADILPFHRRRWKHGWLDARVDKKRYIRCATLLAFRKWQLSLPTGRRQELARELGALRNEVRGLLRVINTP